MSKVVEVDGFAQTVYHHARVVWSAEPFFIALLQVQPERRLHRGPRVPAVRYQLEQRGLPHLRRLHQVLMILKFIQPIPVRRESLVQDVAANIQDPLVW